MDVAGLSASLQEFFVGLVLRDGRRPPVGALAVGFDDTRRARFDVDGSRRRALVVVFVVVLFGRDVDEALAFRHALAVLAQSDVAEALGPFAVHNPRPPQKVDGDHEYAQRAQRRERDEQDIFHCRRQARVVIRSHSAQSRRSFERRHAHDH